jgi:hypothetical protein
MALTKKTSSKCPVCVGCTQAKIKEVNEALSSVLSDVKDSGEVPKAKDHRFEAIAHRIGIAPHSLRYHLKECMLDLEIQDQRFLELKDLSQAISTAKQEYGANPGLPNATAYTSLLNAFMSLASEIEGQQDPEQAVSFIVETAMAPMSRRTLAIVTEEIRNLRDAVTQLVPKNQASYVDSQMKASLTRVSTALRDATDEGLKAICSYYKVELEAKDRKRALEGAAPIQNTADATLALAGGFDKTVH